MAANAEGMSRAAPQARPECTPIAAIEVGVGVAHDRGRRAARREPGDIDPPRIDRVVAHDLARDARDQRRLPLAALLVALAEPVPALLHVRRAVCPG